jgi:hypothetical protein
MEGEDRLARPVPYFGNYKNVLDYMSRLTRPRSPPPLHALHPPAPRRPPPCTHNLTDSVAHMKE